jgi:hypothetical protein
MGGGPIIPNASPCRLKQDHSKSQRACGHTVSHKRRVTPNGRALRDGLEPESVKLVLQRKVNGECDNGAGIDQAANTQEHQEPS